MNDEIIRCYFCNEPSGKIVCDSLKCQKESAEYRKFQEDQRLKMLKTGIRKAFTERAKCENNFYLNCVQRWLYTLKCVLCVLIRRSRPSIAGSYPDSVRVSTIFFNGYWPNDWSAAWLQVGHGIFKQWWYDILEDGEFVYGE